MIIVIGALTYAKAGSEIDGRLIIAAFLMIAGLIFFGISSIFSELKKIQKKLGIIAPEEKKLEEK